MIITTTTTSTSLYDLAVTGLVANHSYTQANAISYMNKIVQNGGIQVILYVASGTVYLSNGITVSTSSGIPVSYNPFTLVTTDLGKLYLIAGSSTTTIVDIEPIY